MTSLHLADGYGKAAIKQWNQPLGALMSLLDAGFEALKASGNPKYKASVAKHSDRTDQVLKPGHWTRYTFLQ